MTRKKLKDIITDHICFDEEESKLNSLIEDIMSELIAELNPPAAPKPRTSDGVDVKDGDMVYVVNKYCKASANIHTGIISVINDRLYAELSDRSICYQDENVAFFSTFPAAIRHIATLLGVEPAETEPMVPLREAVEFASPSKSRWCPVAIKWTKENILKWEDRGGYSYWCFSDKLCHLKKGRYTTPDELDEELNTAIRSQIDAMGKAGEDEGKWVRWCENAESFIRSDKDGAAVRLCEAIVFTDTSTVLDCPHCKYIPLSEAREIEAKRMEKGGSI